MTPILKTEIRENIDKRKKEIIQMYLEMEQGILINSPSKIRGKFHLTQNDLNLIVDIYSKSHLFLGNCEKCNEEIKLPVKTQTQIKDYINSSIHLCPKCKSKFDSKVESQPNFIEKIKARMIYSLELKTFKRLNRHELGFLKEIIRLNSYEKINRFYIKKNPGYYNRVLEKLENLFLIKLIKDRVYYTENIEEIFFLPNLGEHLDYNSNIVSKEEGLNFYIPRRLKKKNSKSPDFSKKIIFNSDIIIKKDTEYITSVWVDSDGGLNFGLKEVSKSKNEM